MKIKISLKLSERLCDYFVDLNYGQTGSKDTANNDNLLFATDTYNAQKEMCFLFRYTFECTNVILKFLLAENASV